MYRWKYSHAEPKSKSNNNSHPGHKPHIHTRVVNQRNAGSFFYYSTVAGSHTHSCASTQRHSLPDPTSHAHAHAVTGPHRLPVPYSHPHPGADPNADADSNLHPVANIDPYSLAHPNAYAIPHSLAHPNAYSIAHANVHSITAAFAYSHAGGSRRRHGDL